MTSIAAIVHKRKVYMSCDSCTSCGSYRFNKGEGKICTKSIKYRGKQEEMLIGTSGLARTSNIIQHLFEPPERKCSVDKYLMGDFTDAFRECLKKHGALHKEHEIENSNQWSLIGYKGKIYMWESNYTITPCVDGFEVEGSGILARGVLYALKDVKNMTPKEKLKRTQEYAAYYSSGVRPPFYYYEV